MFGMDTASAYLGLVSQVIILGKFNPEYVILILCIQVHTLSQLASGRIGAIPDVDILKYQVL
jgi:hypothetical protein